MASKKHRPEEAVANLTGGGPLQTLTIPTKPEC